MAIATPTPALDALERTGHGLLAALPVLMVFANRSSPLVLGLAALLLTASLVRHGLGPTLTRKASALWLSPLGRVGMIALGWAAVSTAWSADHGNSLRALGELLVPLLASMMLAACWQARKPPDWFVPALSVGLCLSGLLIIVEVKLGFPFRNAYRGRLDLYVENRPTITALLLLWPLLIWPSQRPLATRIAMVAIIAVAVTVSYSGAAKLGLAAGLAASGLAWLLPRHAPRLCIGVLIGLLCIQPFIGTIAGALLPEPLVKATEEAHSRERIAIWQSFGDVARARFASGIGFGASARAGQDPVAGEIASDRREMLDVGHPHDALLQGWVELGLPGAALIASMLVLLCAQLERATKLKRLSGLGLFASASAIGLVGHGAWQGWWVAAIGLACALLALPVRAPAGPCSPSPPGRGT